MLIFFEKDWECWLIATNIPRPLRVRHREGGACVAHFFQWC
jgi:hypothetical protein